MRRKDPTPIVLDTSVLLNFVKIGRIELLGRLGTSVVLLDQVLDEVRRPEQRKAVEDAVAVGTLGLQSVRNPTEVALFAELQTGGRLGAGECAVLAVALSRGWIAGLQDRRAKVEGKRRRKDLAFYQTEDLMLKLIWADLGWIFDLEETDGFLGEYSTQHELVLSNRLTVSVGTVKQ